MWAIDPKEIGEPFRHHAKVAGETFRPTRFQGQIVTTADVDAIHSARHHIKAGRKNNGIQWEFRVAYNEALFGKSMNGRFQ